MLLTGPPKATRLISSVGIVKAPPPIATVSACTYAPPGQTVSCASCYASEKSWSFAELDRRDVADWDHDGAGVRSLQCDRVRHERPADLVPVA